MSLSGTPSISGTTVTLTLAAAVVASDTDVKVSYTRPDSGTDNKLEDAAGNAVDSFTDQAVTNNTANAAPTAANGRGDDGRGHALHLRGGGTSTSPTPTPATRWRA